MFRQAFGVISRGMKTMHTDHAPKAIGPYSQAIACNGFLYTSGQIPLTPAGEVITGDVKAQATQVFHNLKAVLATADCGFADVVKATVFLTTMDDFPALNEVYQEFMGDHKPARSTVAVAGLPKGARVEIEVVAKIS